jgi:hypothetical protein
MLFLLDNGAHSIKFGHDHEPKCFVLFYFWEKTKEIHTTLPQRVSKRCRPFKGRQANLLRSRDPPLPGQIISPLRTPLRKGPADSKDIIPFHLLTLVKGYVVDWDAQKAIWDGMFLQFLKVASSAPGHRTQSLTRSAPGGHL